MTMECKNWTALQCNFNSLAAGPVFYPSRALKLKDVKPSCVLMLVNCCRSFLVLWLAAIPFVFVASLQWLTIGFCVIVGYALLGFESFGVEIESPFGHDFNDLPLDKISDGIKANLMGALDFMSVTDDSGVIVSRTRLTQTRSKRQSMRIDVWGVPEEEEDTHMQT